MIYDAKHFLQKFEAIPDDLWFVGKFTDPDEPSHHCALGHCGWSEDNDENEEANSLDRIFRFHGLQASSVNDNDHSPRNGPFHQETPKARILAALESFL